ncbi:MAG TPA: GHMP kinase [Vicinamibacteria bacterium]|nr:GHMP kinase [Vicinamibacteria bacterium]
MKGASADAPTRIDLAGGTLDIWPLYLFHPGAVTVNVAIDQRARCRVEPRAGGVRVESLDTGAVQEAADVGSLTGGPDAPLAAFVLQALGVQSGLGVETCSCVPAGSGLGGSSALAVAVAGAVARAAGMRLAEDQVWPVVRDAEARCIGVPTGIQDYLAALHGGLLAIHLEAGRIRVERLAVEPGRIEEWLLLVDAGATRFSGINNWEVFKGRIDGDPRVRGSLDAIARVATEVRAALLEGRFEALVALLAEEWEARKRLAPAVTSPEIDRIAAAAASAGGAAKVCGAGGGGMVAVWIEPARREDARRSVTRAGFACVPFRVAREGLRVEDVP